jgi:hypothetical protein
VCHGKKSKNEDRKAAPFSQLSSNTLTDIVMIFNSCKRFIGIDGLFQHFKTPNYFTYDEIFDPSRFLSRSTGLPESGKFNGFPTSTLPSKQRTSTTQSLPGAPLRQHQSQRLAGGPTETDGKRADWKAG